MEPLLQPERYFGLPRDNIFIGYLKDTPALPGWTAAIPGTASLSSFATTSSSPGWQVAKKLQALVATSSLRLLYPGLDPKK